jgi:hypothetical protein
VYRRRKSAPNRLLTIVIPRTDHALGAGNGACGSAQKAGARRFSGRPRKCCPERTLYVLGIVMFFVWVFFVPMLFVNCTWHFALPDLIEFFRLSAIVPEPV